MEANELRIGNLITTSEREHSVTLWDLEKIIERNDHWKNKAVKPIELTEEWLLKFGFQCVHELDKSWYARYQKETGDGQTISISQDDGKCYFFWKDHNTNEGYSRYVYDVHTLQNLYFMLSGEELTITK